MIDNSDNDSATSLWREAGGGAALRSDLDGMGISGITLVDGHDWGDSTASPQAVADLLFKLARGEILDAPDRTLALQLLSDVEVEQRWGVTAGFFRASTASVKDGWYPNDDGWWVNSAGLEFVRGMPEIIVTLTSGQPSLEAGIAMIEESAKLETVAIHK